ncbi:MAG: hypothetical protein CMJ63_00015 [Planctomycetaceae bacterium]|nr:hypothetical protein [Planctomycetaceae bacterium]
MTVGSGLISPRSFCRLMPEQCRVSAAVVSPRRGSLCSTTSIAAVTAATPWPLRCTRGGTNTPRRRCLDHCRTGSTRGSPRSWKDSYCIRIVLKSTTLPTANDNAAPGGCFAGGECNRFAILRMTIRTPQWTAVSLPCLTTTGRLGHSCGSCSAILIAPNAFALFWPPLQPIGAAPRAASKTHRSTRNSVSGACRISAPAGGVEPLYWHGSPQNLDSPMTKTHEPPQIRTATDEDIPVLRELFEAGVFESQVHNNDTGADIEQLHDAYFSDAAQGGFWVATQDDEIAGMIGVQRLDESVAEMRRLRVRPQFRRQGIATALMTHAIRFCRDHDYLKVVLDVRVERQPAIQLFEKCGFYLARAREQDGRRTLDFFVDLYSDPR